jgi:hypothetical protein
MANMTILKLWGGKYEQRQESSRRHRDRAMLDGGEGVGGLVAYSCLWLLRMENVAIKRRLPDFSIDLCMVTNVIHGETSTDFSFSTQ